MSLVCKTMVWSNQPHGSGKTFTEGFIGIKAKKMKHKRRVHECSGERHCDMCIEHGVTFGGIDQDLESW